MILVFDSTTLIYFAKLKILDMSEIAFGANSSASAKGKPAISEHAQEHAPGFSPAVLDKLERLKAERIVPESVYGEVVNEGKRVGKDDAFLIEIAVNNGVFNVKSAGNRDFVNALLKMPSIDYADAETLALAKELKGIAILDETPSRAAAGIESIKYHGSVFLLFLLCRQRLIPKDEIKKNIDRMIALGWRCSTELYAAVMDEIRRL